MKRVVLLDTSVGTLNHGDDIINMSIKKNWPELFEDNYVMRLASHTPMYTALQAKLYREKLDMFKSADYKFLCGTNALYTNMLRPLPTWNINILNCGLAEKTVCLGVGMGVNSREANLYTRKLYDKVLSHDCIHSVRDERTKRFLEGLGFSAENTGCPTLWGIGPEHCREIPAKKADNVVFTLTYYNRDEINDREMINILNRNYEHIFFWPQCFKDLEYMESLGVGEKIDIVSPNVDSYDKILSMGNLDYVGNRLHGGIFALQHKCRSIIISIDYRAEGMRENYSFECLNREYILSELEEKINTPWETSIKGIDLEKIENWKKQFK